MASRARDGSDEPAPSGGRAPDGLPPGLPAVDALGLAVARHPAGQRRPGQTAMCEAVERAIAERRHLLVEAGTGTGKSLAYLVPAVLAAVRSRREPGGDDDADERDRVRVVVATATKALQEQLVGNDLPFLADALAEAGLSFRSAMLKGRGNYLCVAKTAEAVDARLGRGTLTELPAAWERHGEAIDRLAWWAWHTPTGDRADLEEGVDAAVWSQVSVDAQECPGASECRFGGVCFAERARRRAQDADVVVVNTHLYGLHLRAGSTILPPHDVVVFDEAHTLEDSAAAAFGATVAEGRLLHLAGSVRRLLARSTLPDRLGDTGRGLSETLAPLAGSRVYPHRPPLAPSLVAARDAVLEAVRAVRGIAPTSEDALLLQRQCLRLADGLLAEVEAGLRAPDELDSGGDRPGAADDPSTATDTPGAAAERTVAWVESDRGHPRLRIAPVDVGPILARTLLGQVTVVATSATLTVGGRFEPLAWQIGLRGDNSEWDRLRIDSPFDYRRQALLYCALHLPDPRQTGFAAAAHGELAALVGAAGGRTLALFTSRAAMRAAADALRGSLPGIAVVCQDEAPRALLVRRLLRDPATCLVATQSFWQGVDIPGDALTLVTIDRLPFAPPDDPLAQARREAALAAGANPFHTVDLPRAARLLAQGAGRLIRSTTDRGVVAVLDRRLGTSTYAWSLVRSLPPMRRTRDHREVVAFLRGCRAGRGAGPASG